MCCPPPSPIRSAQSRQAEAKTRNLVLNNRVIGGVLITQTRSGTGACDERFRHLQDECQLTRLSSAPFGSDPVFVQSSSLFNPALKTTDFYTSAELNALGVPYGFFSSRDDPFTFTVWVDINDDEGKANATLTYLQVCGEVSCGSPSDAAGTHRLSQAAVALLVAEMKSCSPSIVPGWLFHRFQHEAGEG